MFKGGEQWVTRTAVKINFFSSRSEETDETWCTSHGGSQLYYSRGLRKKHQNMEKMILLIVFCLVIVGQEARAQYNVYRQDPFALLSATLQTYQRASCDGQALNLECPTGTKISIQLVQYGRSKPSSEVRHLTSKIWKSDTYFFGGDFEPNTGWKYGFKMAHELYKSLWRRSFSTKLLNRVKVSVSSRLTFYRRTFHCGTPQRQ